MASKGPIEQDQPQNNNTKLALTEKDRKILKYLKI